MSYLYMFCRVRVFEGSDDPRETRSMEIVGLRRRALWESLDVAGFDGNHAIEILQDTFNQQEGLAQHRELVAVEHPRGHNGVHNAGLVFHAEENETLGRAGALSDDHGARNPH